MLITYEANNSGGYWWIKDEHWKKLEDNGWTVRWMNKRFLGAIAMEAKKDFKNIDDALKDFEEITGLNPYEVGCPCCGEPHYFCDY